MALVVPDEMLRSLGLFPAWSCRGKSNTVSLVLLNRPKRSTLFFILLAVTAAVILGILGTVIPENVRMNVNNTVLSPLSNSFLGLLNTFAGLMIFLTICSGILGMGDSATLEERGNRSSSGLSAYYLQSALCPPSSFCHL